MAAAIPKALRVALKSDAILTSPRFNKGTAFSIAERKAFGLTGRLPYRVNTLEEQCERAYDQLKTRDSPIRMNTFLQSMKDQNWVLYYGLLARHLKELIPIIYTPTQADAISNYSHLFRRSEGMYLTFPHQDDMEEVFLEQTKGREIDLIVCSDAEAILGIGDQGVGGIGIVTAKSALYTLIGGVDPSRALSITLDVGTDNNELLYDPLYVGWSHERVRGEAYDKFIDKFVRIVHKHYPKALLHFEDFGVTNAHRILQRYRPLHPVFNDDIQGTGAVTLSCMMAAVGVTKTTLAQNRFVVFGAGTAGIGIVNQLRDAMVAFDRLTPRQAEDQFWLVDRDGLIKESTLATARDNQLSFVRADYEFPGKDRVSLLEVIRIVRPTVLIGCSTVPGAFTEEIVRTMAANTRRPIILSLSNPSRLVEVDPSLANEWTGGQALLATGSPFPPAKMPNGKEYVIAECNNALIYPGLGFGSLLAESSNMTDTMIMAGARRLASLSPALKNSEDSLLPDLGDAREVNFEVAVAVAEQSIKEGSAGVKWSVEEVREKAKAKLWVPEYVEYILDAEGDTLGK